METINDYTGFLPEIPRSSSATPEKRLCSSERNPVKLPEKHPDTVYAYNLDPSGFSRHYLERFYRKTSESVDKRFDQTSPCEEEIPREPLFRRHGYHDLNRREGTAPVGVEIWPNAWKPLRGIPDASSETKNEYPFYSNGYNIAMRCRWDGIHKSSQESLNEVTDSMRFGNNCKVKDKRNGIPYASCGDKAYQAAEYSPNFHRQGSALPLANFSGNKRKKADTFIPLYDPPKELKENYYSKELQRMRQRDVNEVERLDKWRPATPLSPPVKPSTQKVNASQTLGVTVLHDGKLNSGKPHQRRLSKELKIKRFG